MAASYACLSAVPGARRITNRDWVTWSHTFPGENIEQVTGSLTPGKLADMALLNENPFSVDSAYIKDIEVIMAVLGGQVIRDSRLNVF